MGREEEALETVEEKERRENIRLVDNIIINTITTIITITTINTITIATIMTSIIFLFYLRRFCLPPVFSHFQDILYTTRNFVMWSKISIYMKQFCST